MAGALSSSFLFRSLRAFCFLSASLALIASETGPANDDFPGTELLELPAAIRTGNAGATRQLGEPRIVSTGLGATLWWTWRAPGPGRLNLKAFDYFISLGIFQGERVDRLTFLSSGTGTVSAPVQSGGLYRILVDAWPDDPVGVWFDASFEPAPENDNIGSATLIPGTRGTVISNNRGASLETGESAQSPAVGATVWYSWTAPVAGWVTLTTTSTNGRPFLKVYRESRLHPTNEVAISKAGGSIEAEAEFEASPGATYYIAVDTWPLRGDEPSFADFEMRLDLTTLHIVAPANGASFPPGLLPAFAINEPLASIDGSLKKVEYRFGDFSSSFGATTNPPFNLTAPWIHAGRWEVRAYAENESGDVRRSPPVWFTVRPDNDDFANSIKLAGYRWGFDEFHDRFSVRGTTRFATGEPGEPLHGAKPPVATTWFSWTAPATGSAELYFEPGSGVALAAYTGETLSQLVPVTLAHTPGEPFSRLEVARGTTYHLAAFSESPDLEPVDAGFGIALDLPAVRLSSPADGTIAHAPASLPLAIETIEEPGRIQRVQYWADQTPVAVSEIPPFEAIWRQPAPGLHAIKAVALTVDGFQIESPAALVTVHPANDNFAARIPLSGPIVSATGIHAAATQEPGEPAHGLQSIWWSWTAPAGGPVIIDTAGTAHDPRVAIYIGTELKTLDPVASGSGQFEFQASGGVTYAIAVADSLFGGQSVLNIRLSRPVIELQTLSLSAGGLAFKVLAAPGDRFDIDTSTNLIDWTLFDSVTAPESTSTVAIPPRPDAARLFIRLRPE